MKIRNTEFDFSNHTYIMGILNVTPDSFSDGGEHYDINVAINHALKMQKEGAAIIDVGGESTRPGYETISVEEEIQRVVPVIRGIRQQSDVVISIDTYKAKVLEAALEAGADIANDVSCGIYSDYLKLTARAGVPYILMHNNSFGKAETKDNNKSVTDTYDEYVEDIAAGIARARKNGITDSRIIVDPGIGFGKSDHMNLEAVKRIGELNELGYPVLLAASRKSIIGRTLDVTVDERLEGTLALTAYAVMNNIGMVRVHDVKENYRVIKMLEALREC